MKFEVISILYLIAPIALMILLTFRHKAARNMYNYLLSALRLISITLLTVALAAPYSTKERPAESILALVDISASIDERVGEDLLRNARELSNEVGVPLTILPFGKSPAPVTLPAESTSFRNLRSSWEKLDSGATNIEQALLATSHSEGSLALLLSDGYETTGSIASKLPTMNATRVFPLAIEADANSEGISISQLYAPLTVKAQKSAEIRATLTNSTSAARTGTITIKHGEKAVLTKRVTVQPGQDIAVTAQSDPSLEGLNQVLATFSWSDDSTEHSATRAIWLSGEKRDKVLIVSGTSEDDRYLSRILSSQAYQLRSEIASNALGGLGSPADYRVVILNNVPRSALPERFQDTLPTAVREGTGLIMIGGNRSFGLGGYIDSNIEPLLPVRLVPPHTEKKRLNLAIQLVIDKSRSMAADQKLDFAKAAGNEVIRSLKDEDYLGIIGFDDNPFLALPLALVRDVRDIAADRIGRLFPRNKTNLFPALDEARNGLTRVTAGRKHVIVLTDGKLPDAGEYYFELIRQMRTLGITVSTVLIGSDHDQGFLAEMARVGGGSHYQTDDPSNLPRIFLSDVKVASGEQTLKETTDLIVRVGPSGVVSTQLSSFPSVRGFVQTLAREAADTELVTVEEDKAYPILASWNVGKGRSVAFTSDANGRWSSNWMRWESINEFWSDILESVIPKGGKRTSGIPFDMRSWLEGGELVVDLSIFQEIGASKISAVINTPLGEERALDFRPESPGHYRARLDRPTAGTYKVATKIGDAQLPPVAWTLSGELFGEQRYRKPNLQLLEQIASHTHGKVNPSAKDLQSSLTTISDKSSHQLPFLIAAFLVLLLEILFREFGGVRRFRNDARVIFEKNYSRRF